MLWRPERPTFRMKEIMTKNMPMSNMTHETAPTQFVQAGNIRFAYRRFGPRGGTPLLLLNYFAAHMDNWNPKVTNGFASEHDVFLVRLSGHRQVIRRDAVDCRGADQRLRRILSRDRPDALRRRRLLTRWHDRAAARLPISRYGPTNHSARHRAAGR